MEQMDDRGVATKDFLYVIFRSWRRMLSWGIVLFFLIGIGKGALQIVKGGKIVTVVLYAFIGLIVGLVIGTVINYVKFFGSAEIQDYSMAACFGPVIGRLPEMSGKHKRGRKLDRFFAKRFGVGLKSSELQRRVEALAVNVAGLMAAEEKAYEKVVLIGDARSGEMNKLAQIFNDEAKGAFRVVPAGDVMTNVNAAQLLREADVAIAVVHRGVSRTDTIRANVTQAQKTGVKLLGVVLTCDWAILE